MHNIIIKKYYGAVDNRLRYHKYKKLKTDKLHNHQTWYNN